MDLPEDSIILYPNTLEEALTVKKNHPDAKIICTFSSFFKKNTKPGGVNVFIDLSETDGLNFFMEDHGFWFIGSSFPFHEFAEICQERLPELSSILLQYDEPVEESAIDWFNRKKARLHVSVDGEMRIIPFPEVSLEILSSGIPCLISIPKK